ncbi:MAG: phosphohydrolase [Alphaproteobacteria bacterium]|jgi:predicted metal-dependent HD superfamily phosphohydrolase|nr:phosphohydrolase [Alphaproteobacteria bacterium]MBU2042620.1 phosphohydrolase [Alphaproteobacteria bacterium]MBU2125978.1 phosphohydrolase [Alphaproteobacteria bacterium]MBU2209642.1 phosphohydrolase [Alphaproteobacteria bacterium]MBU2292022.1 phosphohydrolase [Alphaproteobacteria bacterium]
MISGAVRDELIARYSEPHRRYHTVTHIEDCLAQVAASTDMDENQRTLMDVAIWFHDAIYDATRTDNEAESAKLAADRLAAEGASQAFIDEVVRLILLTAGHSVQADDVLGARLVSIDLSILGAEPDRYDAYAAAIREEYAHVPEPLYRAGRAAILGRFLESEALFADPIWAERFEAQARANLTREIADLTA